MIHNNLKASHIRRLDSLREPDRKKLGVDFTILGSIEFDRVFEAKEPKSNFVLMTENEQVKMAYDRMVNPKKYKA